MAEAGGSSEDCGNRRILTLSNISSKSHDSNEGAMTRCACWRAGLNYFASGGNIYMSYPSFDILYNTKVNGSVLEIRDTRTSSYIICTETANKDGTWLRKFLPAVA